MNTTASSSSEKPKSLGCMWILVAIGAMVLIGVLALLLWLSPIGQYDRDFSLEWDEEVKLHDGRMIGVHIKRKFRRQSQRSQWKHVWYLGTEISFDAGEPWGRYTRYFQGYDVALIDIYQGNWYIKLRDAAPGSGPNPRIVPQYFPYVKLSGTKVVPVNGVNELPHFPLNNVMSFLTTVESISQFDGKKLDWNNKIDYLRLNKPNYKKYINVPLREGLDSHVGITKHIGVEDDK